MANITSYKETESLASNDLFIISDTSEANSTKSVKTSTLSSYITSGSGSDSVDFTAPIHVNGEGSVLTLSGEYANSSIGIDFKQTSSKRAHIQFQDANDALDIRTENPGGAASRIRFSVAANGQPAEEAMRILSARSGVNSPQVVIGNPNSVSSGRELYVKGGIEATSQLYVGDNASISGRCDADSYKVKGLNDVPATATSPGVVGEIRYTSNYIYVCVANNVWKRTALTTW